MESFVLDNCKSDTRSLFEPKKVLIIVKQNEDSVLRDFSDLPSHTDEGRLGGVQT